MSDEAPAVLKTVAFKKRSNGAKKSIRSKPSAVLITKEDGGVEDDDDNDDEVDAKTLEEIRFEQELRKRRSGLDSKKINKTEKSSLKTKTIKKEELKEGGAPASLSTVSHVEAAFRSEGASGGADKDTVQHETIMEEYVNNALGLQNVQNQGGASQSSAEAGDQDQEITLAAEAREAAASNADVGISLAITEVELPSAYRERNILDTEQARKDLIEKGRKRLAKQGKSGLREHLGYRDMMGGYNGMSDRYLKPMSFTEFEQKKAVQEERDEANKVVEESKPQVASLPSYFDVEEGVGARVAEQKLRYSKQNSSSSSSGGHLSLANSKGQNGSGSGSGTHNHNHNHNSTSNVSVSTAGAGGNSNSNFDGNNVGGKRDRNHHQQREPLLQTSADIRVMQSFKKAMLAKKV